MFFEALYHAVCPHPSENGNLQAPVQRKGFSLAGIDYAP